MTADPTIHLNHALAGRYEISREIGHGGMATVYLARDIRHSRNVALKVLDPELGAVLGAERFLSEIRVTANLQHPNLLPLFDSGEADGLLFYAMPYVEGETLRARISREKQLPVPEAVRIASAVANALDYAHRHGVIHRDLKPENILLHEGEPLVADFGIALAVSNAGGTRVTQTGLSLGTPHYMSPEQASGDRNVDGRTDVYSLGAVTYEMLSGEPPHSGTTAQAIIARLMTEEPRALSVLRRAVPEGVEHAVQCALEKVPADRFQSAREFADALNGRALAPAHSGRSRVKNPLVTARGAALIAGGMLFSAGAAWIIAMRSRTEPPQLRMDIALPPGHTLEDAPGVSLGISPDGQSIAYIAHTSTSAGQIYVRRLSEWDPHSLTGTEEPWEPRFSPDGRSLVFGANGQPKIISVDGGTVSTLQARSTWSGITWGSDGTIALASSGRLLTFGAVGGTPRVVYRADSSRDETQIYDPLVIPAEGIIAFRVGLRRGSRLATVPLQGGKATVFDLLIANPIAFDRGWLLYGLPDGTVSAVELRNHGTVLGDRRVPLLEGALYKSSGGVEAAIAGNGSLLYLAGKRTGHLAFYARDGKVLSVGQEQRIFAYPQVSPDGKHIAVTVSSSDQYELWVLDVGTGTMSRLANGSRPSWTPDGRHVVFINDTTRTIDWIPADASGPVEHLTKGPYSEVQVTPDGKSLVARSNLPGQSTAGIFLLPLSGDRTPVTLVAAPATLLHPRVSPDGHWLAYASEESGRLEVYVRPLMGGARTQVSVAGGMQPVWSRDGKRISYYNNNSIFSVDVQDAGSSLAVGKRDSLFSIVFGGNATTHQQYDIAPDGRYVGADLGGGELRLKFVTNWMREVRQKLK